MKTKSGTSPTISSRKWVKRLPFWIESMMIACGRPSRQKLAASSTEPTKSTSMLMLRKASRIRTLTSRREATRATWLPARAFELPDCDEVSSIRSPRGLHPSPAVFGNSEDERGHAGDVFALDDQAHRPGGLLDQAAR